MSTMGYNADQDGAHDVGAAYIGASTYKRTAADEVTDINQFKENLARAAFEDWPNEAGVSIVMHLIVCFPFCNILTNFPLSPLGSSTV